MERNLKPNPIRSSHYGEMSWRGSDGEREILGKKRGERWEQREKGRGKCGQRIRREKRMTGKREACMMSSCQIQCQLMHTDTHKHTHRRTPDSKLDFCVCVCLSVCVDTDHLLPDIRFGEEGWK